MSDGDQARVSPEALAAEGGTALPPKEVLSLLDLNVNLDLMLDLAAPIDLAVAGNLNAAAPVDAAASANVLSAGSTAQGLADQDVVIDQGLFGEAIATAPQTSVLDQSDAVEGTDPVVTDPDVADTGAADLLDVNVDLSLDADIAAPIAGAVALNANIAAPIDAAVAANIGSIDSDAVAIADQDAVIVQHLEGVAEATADQDSTITQ